MIVRIVIENEILNEINKEERRNLAEFLNYREVIPMYSGDLFLSFQTKNIYKRFLNEIKPCYPIHIV